MLDAGYWMLDAGQIMDDLAPISRLEGDIFYRGYWMLDAGQIMDDLIPISRLEGDIFYRGYWMLDTGCKISDNRDLCPPIKACPGLDPGGGLRGVF